MPAHWTGTGRTVSLLLAGVSLAGCAVEGLEGKLEGAPESDAGAPPVFFVDASQEPPDGSIRGDFAWGLPPGFPLPVVPAENPMSPEKVELGRHLFYDKRLSINERLSCASCHKQSLAFTDGRRTGLGTTGEDHPRSSMSLANVGYAATLTWADPELSSLEEQALVPVVATHPVELGFTSLGELEARLRAISAYQSLFARAFPDDQAPIHARNVARALSAFQRTLISGRSPFDRWIVEHEEAALSDSAKRGFALFTSERLRCSRCHAGFNLTDNVSWHGGTDDGVRFHNSGLYDVDGEGGYPAPNTGVHAITGRLEDMGLFKVPTLRNVAVTAPYMHDGSIATLSEVLDHYAAGGRSGASTGKPSPLKDSLIGGFELTASEREDLLSFLESLTDQAFLTDPRFANPW